MNPRCMQGLAYEYQGADSRSLNTLETPWLPGMNAKEPGAQKFLEEGTQSARIYIRQPDSTEGSEGWDSKTALKATGTEK